MNIAYTIVGLCTLPIFLIACGSPVEENSRIALNKAPQSNNDFAQGYRNEPITINVLANDIDPDGMPLSLKSYSSPKNGTVTQTGKVLEYIPDKNFSGNDIFDYTMSDNSGLLSTSTVTIKISAWSQPIQLGNGKDVNLAVSDNGSAVSIWDDGTTIYTNQFLLDKGWQTALPLYTTTGVGRTSNPQVKINSYNQALSVWKITETDSSGSISQKIGAGLLSGAIWAVETFPWQEIVSDQPTSMSIALNNNGVAVIAWDQITPTNNSNFRTRTHSSITWDASPYNHVFGESYAQQPYIASNSSYTVVAWIQSSPSTAWWKYKYAGRWQPPKQLSSSNNLVKDVRLTMSNKNEGIVTWLEENISTTSSRIVGRIFKLNDGTPPQFNAPFYLDNGNGNISTVTTDANDNGNVAIAWQQSTTSGSAIYVYQINTSNRLLTKVSEVDEYNASSPSVTISSEGRIVVAWHENENILMKEFENDWLPIKPIATTVQFKASSLQIDSDSKGNVVSVWQLENSSLWSTDFCLAATGCEQAVPEHNTVGESCENCHDGTLYSGKNIAHIPTSEVCLPCHKTSVWTPAVVNHSATFAPCLDCHNGLIAQAESIGHFESSNNNCDNCHSITSWRVLQYNHTSINYPITHFPPATCGSCHTTQKETELLWQNSPYINSCAGCHEKTYIASLHIFSPGTVYDISLLYDCTGSCHIYTDATGNNVAQLVPNHHSASNLNWR